MDAWRVATRTPHVAGDARVVRHAVGAGDVAARLGVYATATGSVLSVSHSGRADGSSVSEGAIGKQFEKYILTI